MGLALGQQEALQGQVAQMLGQQGLLLHHCAHCWEQALVLQGVLRAWEQQA